MLSVFTLRIPRPELRSSNVSVKGLKKPCAIVNVNFGLLFTRGTPRYPTPPPAFPLRLMSRSLALLLDNVDMRRSLMSTPRLLSIEPLGIFFFFFCGLIGSQKTLWCFFPSAWLNPSVGNLRPPGPMEIVRGIMVVFWLIRWQQHNRILWFIQDYWKVKNMTKIAKTCEKWIPPYRLNKIKNFKGLKVAWKRGSCCSPPKKTTKKTNAWKK